MSVTNSFNVITLSDTNLREVFLCRLKRVFCLQWSEFTATISAAMPVRSVPLNTAFHIDQRCPACAGRCGELSPELH